MEQMLTDVIKSIIFPPGLFLVLLLLVVFLQDRKPRLSKQLLSFGLVVFYAVSTPLGAGWLIAQVETYPALDPLALNDSKAQAIVVLASSRERNAEEYGSDTVGPGTLVRSRYGAFLQRKTGLPILVSGGLRSAEEGKSLALVMAELLRTDFHAGVVWLEDQSRTTGENAFYSKKILDQKKINTIYLVTQASHMPRSVAEFEKNGLHVIAAPTAFQSGIPLSESNKLRALLPAAWALNTSVKALHEMLGILWYKFRY